MKTRLFLSATVTVVLIGIVLAVSTPAVAASFTQIASGAATNYVPGEILIKFKPMTSEQTRLVSVAAQGHSVFASLSQPGWVQVKIKTGQTVEAAVADYQNDQNVEYVQPNYIYHTTLAPSDAQYGQLWAFKNIGQTITTGNYTPISGTPGDDMNIEKAWDHITDCSSVIVAVVDSGVNYNQEDLAENMWNGGAIYPNHGWNYVNGNNDPMDLNGHGTHVAGIIGAAGNNASGVTGVCWKASIMAVRVLDATGKGTTANIVQGINFAVSHGAKVINMSLGGGGSFDSAFSQAITYAQNNDVVVVVAAGNNANNNDAVASGSAFYPCNFSQPNLVCVAALDQNFALANFSNYGSTSVDVGAPGTNILSTWAGTDQAIADSLMSGWTLTTTTSGGWAYGNIVVSGVPTPFLLDPANYISGTYKSSTDDRAYKTFNLSGVNVAMLQFYAAINILTGDHFRIGFNSAGGDPFAGGTIIDDKSYLATYPYLISLSYDISRCISTDCSIGFQLQSDAALADMGLAITGFGIKTLTYNTSSYKIADGTSMATPEVAGLAAMLRAFNPQYTFADTVNAIKNGGRSIPSLAGWTTTGKAIDVMSSLTYISAPTGLTATVQ